MIINNSRSENFKACPTRSYNWDELRLVPHRVADPLLFGGGFHAGVELANQGEKNLEKIVDASEVEYRKRMLPKDAEPLLPEEITYYDGQIAKVRSIVRAYSEHWTKENFVMLQPEVTFRVPLPHSEHHCYYVHKLLHPNEPIDVTRSIDEHGNITRPSPTSRATCDDPRCFIPHYLSGTTDAIIQMNKVIWLQEHKTTAYDLYNNSSQSRNWIDAWYLASQASCYIYGIWKSIGVFPHGVLLNAVIKPRSNAKFPTYSFYREGFLRTVEQLERYEKEITLLATRYEHVMRTGETWMNDKACMNYNRKCDYWDSCIRGHIVEGEFITRTDDYINKGYYEILGIDPPENLKGMVKDEKPAVES